MSAIRLIVVLFSLINVLLFAAPPALAQAPDSASKSAEFVAGEVVVKFKPNKLSGQDSLQKDGIRVVEASPRGGLVRVAVTPGTEAETIETLAARSDVEFATLNYFVHTMVEPDDYYYQNNYQWGIDKIMAPQAWDINTGAESIVIAVVDTGMDLDHPDLVSKLWVNSDEIAGNGLDDDGNGYVDDRYGYDFYNNDSTPDDDNGHGSHVSGIAAAATNNGTGVAGVSWGAKLMPLKALNQYGGGSTAGVAQAIYYAVDNGAHVINMSLGATGSSWPCGWSDVENALNHAVNNNVLVVVASGNDGKYGVSCPGAYDQVMAVGATTSSDARAYFSNWGPRLDIVAPGNAIYSTLSNGGYGYKSGTSMATPHVAGLAALVWGMDISQSAGEVRQTIETSADDLGSAGKDETYGYGRINAYAALESFTLLTLQYPSGLEISGPITFIADDDPVTAALPGSRTVQVTTLYPNVLTWTAAISPTVPWVSISPSTSGQVSSFSTAEFDLDAVKPAAHGTYTTSLVVTGTTPSGSPVGPTTREVRINYVPELYKYRFPLIMK